MARLTSRFILDLLIRKAQADGGFAMILAKGDEHSGGILVQCCDRGRAGSFMERQFSGDSRYIWSPVGPSADSPESERVAYVEKRRKVDPDLWVIELDIANPEQFVVAWRNFLTSLRRTINGAELFNA